MSTAILLLVILTLSGIAIRVGAVALWMTGLPEHVARFQARSALTTTGFTTPEASLVVNHPKRRRIIGRLMIIGNAGIVSLTATIILSYVNFEVSAATLVQEALWLILAVLVFWVVCVSKWTDRHMMRFIYWCLRARTCGEAEQVESLLLLPNGYQVAAMTLRDGSLCDVFSKARTAGRQMIVLGVLHSDNSYTSAPPEDFAAHATDRVLLYGRTRDLEAG